MARESGSAARAGSKAGARAGASEGLIGQHLRVLRAARGVTLDELAKRTGLTKSYLSKIQNSRKVPPIATLSRIAQALGTGIGSFFGDILEPGDSASVVRKHERQPVVRGGTAFGYDYVSLAPDRLAKSMEPFIFTFPSRIDRHVFFEHGGEEFVFVLSGKVVFQVGDRRFALDKGDSIYFDAAVPHRGWSVGADDATALVVVYSGEHGKASKRAPRARAAVPRKRS